jgi:hypothetical protein
MGNSAKMKADRESFERCRNCSIDDPVYSSSIPDCKMSQSMLFLRTKFPFWWPLIRRESGVGSDQLEAVIFLLIEFGITNKG